MCAFDKNDFYSLTHITNNSV